MLVNVPAFSQDAESTQTAALPMPIDAAALLMQAKQAAGGDAWNRIDSLHFQYHLSSGGLTGTGQEWDDVRTGRFATRYTLPPIKRGNGFDGVSSWVMLDNAGYSYARGDEDTRLGAANQSYRTSRAFWFPERHPATSSFVGINKEGTSSFDVIAVTPQGGRPFQIWIDHTTHLIDRYVEKQAEDVQIIRFSDYRQVEGVQVPFTIRIGDEDPQWDEVDTVQSVAVNTPFAPDQFAMPLEPTPDYHFAKGKTSTTIPFRLDDNEIIIPVTINGQGPFEAFIDTGGNAILQPALAKRLRLHSAGAAQNGGGGEGFVSSGRTMVETLDIGEVCLSNQVHEVFPIFPDKPERVMIGLEIFKRFVVRLDFDRQTMTLTQPDTFTYRGDGTVVPFHFQDNQPEVYGAVDGIAGTFCIDTGDSASGLLLIAPFVRRYSLVERYAANLPYGGSAVGGETYGLLARAHHVALFGRDGRPAVSVADPVTRLSQQKGGFDANAYVSGNIGMEILRQFNVTFDYNRQQIIFEKNRRYGAREIYSLSGWRLHKEGNQWSVMTVFPGGAAAIAGIKEEDMVLALNGKNASQWESTAMRELFANSKAGGKVTVRIQSGATQRTVTLTLRDAL